MPRVIQLTPTLSYGDAVSNDVFAMSEVLSRMGYENYIVVGTATEKVKSRALPLEKFLCRPEDVLIYHMSIGNPMSQFVINAPARKKLMVYHNITPAEYFEGISTLANACREGRAELKALDAHIAFALCDSVYNQQELIDLGYQNTAVLPIVFDKEEYLCTQPSPEFLSRYQSDDYTNILFVGRIAPNKKQEDIIQSFAIYNKYINPRSRLLLVGAVVDTERYQTALEEYVRECHVPEVHFLGHVNFQDIVAAYRVADIFLCESEHEGFCVPLLEAMTFDVPILAYSESAVPYTMGNSGVLFGKKDHKVIAEIIDMMVSDTDLRESIIKSQRERLAYFNIEDTKASFEKLIKPWL